MSRIYKEVIRDMYSDKSLYNLFIVQEDEREPIITISSFYIQTGLLYGQ